MTATTKYEYKLAIAEFPHDLGVEQLQSFLNKLGEERWQMCSYIPHPQATSVSPIRIHMIFQREKSAILHS